VTTDGGTTISWQLESKEFSDQLRKYFPRYARYDVDVKTGGSATGNIILNEAIKQTHTIASGRSTKARLITHCTGDRLQLRITGTGPVDIFSFEAE